MKSIRRGVGILLSLTSILATRAGSEIKDISPSPRTHDEFGQPLPSELAAYTREKEAQQASANILDVTPLGDSQIDAFRTYAVYAGTAYCLPASTATWTCGSSCDANPSFVTTASGGDGAFVQFWYVGWDPTLKTVIVAHQGTHATKIVPVIVDMNIILRPLSPRLFRLGVPFGVLVHSGFADAQERSAKAVLKAVRTTIGKYRATRVAVVGHSLGAAIGMLSALHLKHQLPPWIEMQFRGFGMPRTGNQGFADYIDSFFGTSGAVQRISNLRDPVPILPTRLLQYSHTSGEVHITEDDVWNACGGQDNMDERCSVGGVPIFLGGNVLDHGGPSGGYVMGEGC